MAAVAGPAVEVDDRRNGRSAPSDAEPAGMIDDLARLLADVLAAEGAPSQAEAGLHLVGRAEIGDLNARHMGVEGPTDVLSFPIDGVADDAAIVGDVVLCCEVAADQADGHAGSFVDECRLLVVHGALHLAGWDHADDAQRDAMWARERALMAELGASPPKDPWT
jgi:probable rRNA maturation factor